MQILFSTYQKDTSKSALTSAKSVLNTQTYENAGYHGSDVARFLSLDPLAAKYPMLSAYNYVAGNPIKYIDPDGKDIVVPDKADRKTVLDMVNSRMKGTFAFDDKVKLYVVKKEDGERFSEYYRDKLVGKG